MGSNRQGEEELWRSLYPFESHYADLGGVRLHYIDEGEGAPVVLLHGNPTWSFYYRRLINALRTNMRVIAVDHVGCGLSDKPQDYPYCLSRHIDNLTWLIDNVLELDRVSLVMHDWGGAIGMGYAVRHPERICRLVLSNTAAFPIPRCPLRIRICRVPIVGSVSIRLFNAFARQALRVATAYPDRITAAIRQGYLAPYDSFRNRIGHLRFVQDIPLSPGHRSWQTLADIQAKLDLLAGQPILICWGEKDFVFTERFLATWQQYFPDALVQRFADAGHYLLEDAHERVLPLVQGFLTAESN